MTPLLEIQNLAVCFNTPEGIARAVDGVGFELAPGETLGLVGESGCGKSVTALSILGLIADSGGRIENGEIRFKGRDLRQLGREDLRQIRGNEIAMIFQEPMTSLNPVLPIGQQVAEPLMVHRGMTRSHAYQEAAAWLDYVRIPGAGQRLKDYPYQLSGGMRQRVMIAMAMVCKPKLLIADEPTTALDVTIQAQILALMTKLKSELGMSLLLITHNLGVVAQTAGRVVVMYAGQVVETAPAVQLFREPFHPYTQGLLKSMPLPGGKSRTGMCRLSEIPGTVPPITEQIPGCKFAPRCPHRFDLCRSRQPDLATVENRHFARCWLMTHPEQRKGNG